MVFAAVSLGISVASPSRAQNELKPWLGVSYSGVGSQTAEVLGLPEAGAIVTALIAGSPAQQAGLQVGDLIMTIDGHAIDPKNDFSSIIARSLPGLTVPITYLRGGESRTARATLIAAPGEIPPLDLSYYGGEGPAVDDNGRHVVGGATFASLNPVIAESLGLEPSARGAVILAIEPGSVAEELGFRRGDTVYSVNLRRTPSALALAETYLAASAGGERTVMVHWRRGDGTSFTAFMPRPEGFRKKWGAYWDLAGNTYYNSKDGQIHQYIWLERGKRLAYSQYAPDRSGVRNTVYYLDAEGNLNYGELTKVGDEWQVSKKLYTLTVVDGVSFDWDGDPRQTFAVDAKGFTATWAEVRRNGTLKTPHRVDSLRLVDETEIERLAASYRQNKARIAQQQQAQAQARQSSGGGGGGLLGALGGAMIGAMAGGNTEQVVCAAMKGAALVDPNMAALDSIGNEMITGQPGPGSGMAGLGGASGGGSYPTRPNALNGNPACSMMNQSNYRDVSLSGGNDVQLKTMCGQAFEYYNMYLNAIRQGYSEADANRTYDAHQQAALNAVSFYQNNR